MEETPGATKTTDEINSVTETAGTYQSDLSGLTYTKSDVDDDETTFTLAGDDAGQFDMAITETNANELTLSFKSPPNYDAPGDADKDNTYKVSVVATDADGLAGMADVEIVVTDVSETGTVTLSPDQPAIGRVVTATLDEPDTEVSGLKWQWQSSSTGADDSFTNIEGEESDTYTPRAAVPDDETTVAVNEAVKSDEGLFLRAVATYIDAAAPLTDADDDEDAQVAQTAMGDSEHAVRAEPDVNGPPDFGDEPIMREVMENTEKGGDVGDKVEATDPDGDVMEYEITGGADMDKFGNTGAQITVGSAEFDFDDPDAQQTFEVELTASDPFGMSGSTMVTITVTDFNEAPSLILRPAPPAENVDPAFADDAATFMVYENMDAGAEVGMVEAIDEGDTLMYSVDSMYFAVDDMGNITTAMMLDHEAMDSHMVTITATDDEEASDSIEVTVTVGDMHPDCTVMDNNGLTNDCEALLDAKADLGGDLDWDAGTAVADWQGVRMSDGRVSGVWLKDVGLDGSVSAAFGRVEMLTVLNLHSNSLSGPIPDLSGASMLEGLYLPNNDLDGAIPASLNGMTSLTNLWLWGNQLTGGIPDLSGLTNLDMLKLAGNMLDGEINAMYLPQNVTWLIIDSNGFSGEIPDLSGLTSLKLLWLHSNALTGEIPDGSKFPASVDDLNLRDNMLSGEIPDLSALDMATRVRLHGNMLTGEVPASLGGLASLKQLWLWDNQLTSINAGLGDLSATLIEIGLNGNPWADGACVPIALADVATNDYGPDNIEACPADDGS